MTFSGIELIETLLSNWTVLDTSSLMSAEHKTKLVEVLVLMCGVIGKVGVSQGGVTSGIPDMRVRLSCTEFLRTIYTLLLDKSCSNKQKIDLVNVLKVRVLPSST